MRKRDFLTSSLVIGAGVGLGAAGTFAEVQPSADLLRSTSRASGPVDDPWPGRKKLLFVADVQTGYHHDAINHTMAVVEQIGRKTGSYVTFLRTDSQLITKRTIPPQGKYVGGRINVKTLDYFDAVFLLPAGDGTMNDEQKSALLSFVHDDGKGLVVGHAAGNAFFDKGGVSVWPEWNNLIGAQMKGEFHAKCRVLVEDQNFPGAMAWGKKSFMFDEQHPMFAGTYSREIDHVVLRLDPLTVPQQYRDQHPDGDFPVAYARQYGNGRVFNMGWGEFEATWDDAGLQNMMLGAIKWALGSVKADITPRPLLKG